MRVVFSRLMLGDAQNGKHEIENVSSLTGGCWGEGDEGRGGKIQGKFVFRVPMVVYNN